MAACGVLNLNKPPGVTSRQAVNRVQRLLPRKTKIGHAGTLDPLAQGVLVVAVGSATRLIETIQQTPKTYRAEFLLGRHSDTEDIEGQVVEIDEPVVPTAEAIRRALPKFEGTLQQRPPAYSALKVGGRRAYDLARRGEHVELASREIVVHRIALDRYDYPALGLTIECGSGTYIRSLGRDIAEAVGTAAVMSALERTAIGPFAVEQAVDPTVLTGDNLAEHLHDPGLAVAHLPRIVLNADAARRVLSGQLIGRPDGLSGEGEFAAFDESNRLISIMVARGRDMLAPKRNFPPEG